MQGVQDLENSSNKRSKNENWVEGFNSHVKIKRDQSQSRHKFKRDD